MAEKRSQGLVASFSGAIFSSETTAVSTVSDAFIPFIIEKMQIIDVKTKFFMYAILQNIR
jgi:hypothetical protein